MMAKSTELTDELPRKRYEKVMGFCRPDEHRPFFHEAPLFDDGIQLIKHGFSVSDGEQERRLQEQIHDPLKEWKLSPMDPQSQSRWVDYSPDEMFVHTDIPGAPGTWSNPTSSTHASTALATCFR